MLNLGPRLKTAADLVDRGGILADIGTDHAYLPAYLILNGSIDKAIACDIGMKPLENAAKTLEAYSLKDKIELRVSDGLDKVLPGEVREIVICGMGGLLIAEILGKADWIRNTGMHLVLQPMTHSEDVRTFLCENGFTIKEERCVIDTGRVYCCISAEYTGEKNSKPYGYYYFGEIKGETPEERAFIDMLVKRITKRADALKNSGTFPEEEALLREVLCYYRERYYEDRQ